VTGTSLFFSGTVDVPVPMAPYHCAEATEVAESATTAKSAFRFMSFLWFLLIDDAGLPLHALVKALSVY
jgi:hypothetical protein